MKRNFFVHSDEYLAANWDRLINLCKHDDYHINLEDALDSKMRPINGLLNEEQRFLVRKTVYAPELVEGAEKKLSKMRKMLEDIDSGKASFGYITQSQEWSALSELHDRYEFNCYQLRVFKEKYGL